jgi:hypothetical protein
MLNQKCFCLPLWVWLVAIGIVVYYYCYSSKNKLQPKPKEEKKEKFANVNNSRVKMLNFNTKWCGWSVIFQPEWDNFTKAVNNNPELKSKIEVIDVKCDDPANKRMCEEYQVPGYPYVIVEKDGNRTPYDGERTAQALLSFVSSY